MSNTENNLKEDVLRVIGFAKTNAVTDLNRKTGFSSEGVLVSSSNETSPWILGKEPKRYKTNLVPNNMNEKVEREPKVIGSTHDLNDYELLGYMLGDHTCTSPKLEWVHFDYVVFFKESYYKRLNRKRTIFIGVREGEEPTTLVAKKK